MLTLDRPSGRTDAGEPLTLEEFLSLSADTRAEIVDGVLRPMTRSNKANRTVQRRIAQRLEQLAPVDLAVFEEEVVVLGVTPAAARIPDVSVVRAAVDPAGSSNHTFAADVLLVVEVVSPTTATADRREKPAEYALAGIPSFWRIELDPDISVTVHRLAGDVYEVAGTYGRGDTVADPALPWAAVEVTPLLGYFA